MYTTAGLRADGLPHHLSQLLMSDDNALKEVPVKIIYNGINSQQYHTEHTIMLTDERDDLRIRFDRFYRVNQMGS